HDAAVAAHRRRPRPAVSLPGGAAQAVGLHLLAVHDPQRGPVAVAQGGTARWLRTVVPRRARAHRRLQSVRRAPRSMAALDGDAARAARPRAAGVLIGRARTHVQPDDDLPGHGAWPRRCRVRARPAGARFGPRAVQRRPHRRARTGSELEALCACALRAPRRRIASEPSPGWPYSRRRQPRLNRARLACRRMTRWVATEEVG